MVHFNSPQWLKITPAHKPQSGFSQRRARGLSEVQAPCIALPDPYQAEQQMNELLRRSMRAYRHVDDAVHDGDIVEYLQTRVTAFDHSVFVQPVVHAGEVFLLRLGDAGGMDVDE